MVEPIPFLGIFNDEEPVSYLRKQLEILQETIDVQKEVIVKLQAALTKAQGQILDQDTGWEMIKNADGSFTVKPFVIE